MKKLSKRQVYEWKIRAAGGIGVMIGGAAGAFIGHKIGGHNGAVVGAGIGSSFGYLASIPFEAWLLDKKEKSKN